MRYLIDLVARLHAAGVGPVIPISSSGALGFVAKPELTAAAVCDLLAGSVGVQERDHR